MNSEQRLINIVVASIVTATLIITVIVLSLETLRLAAQAETLKAQIRKLEDSEKENVVRFQSLTTSVGRVVDYLKR